MYGPSDLDGIRTSLVERMRRGQAQQRPLETPKFQLVRNRQGRQILACWECGSPSLEWNGFPRHVQDQVFMRVIGNRGAGTTLERTDAKDMRCGYCDLMAEVYPAARQEYLAIKEKERAEKNEKMRPVRRRARRLYYRAGRAGARVRKEL